MSLHEIQDKNNIKRHEDITTMSEFVDKKFLCTVFNVDDVSKYLWFGFYIVAHSDTL